MSIARLTGVVPPIATPFTPDGTTVDVRSLERLTEHLVGSGVHAVFALGSTSEVAYLDAMQRELVLRTVVATVAGRVPVLAGAIEMTTTRARAEVHAALAAGADAIVATAPFYARNDEDEIEAHFRELAAVSTAPVYAYDVPVRVHVKLGTDLLIRLGADGVIAGVKDSSGDDVGFRRLITANAAAGSPLSLFTGHEVVVDGMLLLGADGVVPGLANVDPAGYVRLWDFARQGDWAGARAEQDRLAELFEIVHQAPGRSDDAAGVGSFKVAMYQRGLIDSAALAFPLRALDADVSARIEPIVRKAGLLAG